MKTRLRMTHHVEFVTYRHDITDGFELKHRNPNSVRVGLIPENALGFRFYDALVGHVKLEDGTTIPIQGQKRFNYSGWFYFKDVTITRVLDSNARCPWYYDEHYRATVFESKSVREKYPSRRDSILSHQRVISWNWEDHRWFRGAPLLVVDWLPFEDVDTIIERSNTYKRKPKKRRDW